MNTLEKIEKIEMKIRHLALRLERLQEENARLINQKAALETKLATAQEKAIFLEKELERALENKNT